MKNLIIYAQNRAKFTPPHAIVPPINSSSIVLGNQRRKPHNIIIT